MNVEYHSERIETTYTIFGERYIRVRSFLPHHKGEYKGYWLDKDGIMISNSSDKAKALEKALVESGLENKYDRWERKEQA